MNLTDQQGIKLREDIETVLSEDRLKTILFENENTFEKNFYNQISGGDYRTRLINLIRELNNKQLMDHFIAVVGKEYPEVECHYQIYKQLSALVFILKNNFNCIKSFFDYDNIEDLENGLLQLIEAEDHSDNLIISSDQLNSLDSYIELKDFLEKKVTKILTAPKINNNLKEKLKQWIENNFSNVNIPPETQSYDDIINYFFIIIRPKIDNKSFFIESQFAQFDNNQNKIQEMAINLESDNINLQGYLEKEIPDILDKLVKEMHERVQPSPLPTIELFLPINLLSKDFDIKQISDEWNRKKPIGMLYPLTFRSYERFFQKNRLKPVWEEKWNLLQKLINKNDDELIKEKIEILEQQSCCKLKGCIALTVVCPLPETKNKRRTFFQEILSTGVVLCLWTRYKDLNFNKDLELFKKILDAESLKNFCQLPKKILEIRCSQESKLDLGYNLGVLFDHDKIPSHNLDQSQLKSPNSLI